VSDLIPTISFSEFKRLRASEIIEMKSVEVISDGEYAFTVIIPPRGDYRIQQHIKTQAEYLGAKSNSAGGKEPEQILKKEVLV